jgi:hypothetical protein
MNWTSLPSGDYIFSIDVANKTTELGKIYIRKNRNYFSKRYNRMEKIKSILGKI